MAKHKTAPNAGILSKPVHAQVISADPLRLRIGDRQLGLVSGRMPRSDVAPESPLAPRLLLADYIRTLGAVNNMLDGPQQAVQLGADDAERINQAIKKEPFYVPLGTVSLSGQVQLGDEVEVAQVIAVEPRLFDDEGPEMQVVVAGTGNETSILTEGTTLLAPRVPASFDTSDDAVIPHIY